MTKEEAIKILDDYEIVPMDFPYNTRQEVAQAFCMAIDALEALPAPTAGTGMTAKEKIEAWGYEDVLVFDNPAYDSAFLGVSNDNRAVYSYDRMVMDLMETDGMSEEEAADFISYNTIRACDYTQGAPIVLFEMEEI